MASRVCSRGRLPWGRRLTQSAGSHGGLREATAQVPDELRFRVHVSHTVLCKPLVQTVECGSQEAPNDPHHDEETQIHSCPEMTFFIRVRALREGAKGRREKNHSTHENGKVQKRSRQMQGARLSSLYKSQWQGWNPACTEQGPCTGAQRGRRPTGSCTYPSDHLSLVLYLRAIVMGQLRNSGGEDKTYLKFAKIQQSRELEGTPTSKLNPRTKEVEGEGGRHGTKELGDRGQNQEHSIVTSPTFSLTLPHRTYCSTGKTANSRTAVGSRQPLHCGQPV